MVDKVIEINYNIITEGNYEVEFDDNKNLINIQKHGVDFNEAAYVLEDECALYKVDEQHSSNEEERFLILGFSNQANMLVVSFCIRVGNRIRIISARKATKNEERDYSNQ